MRNPSPSCVHLMMLNVQPLMCWKLNDYLLSSNAAATLMRFPCRKVVCSLSSLSIIRAWRV